MTEKDLNILLMDAVGGHNPVEVERLLKLGADPNFELQKDEFLDGIDFEMQPYSPLRLIVFQISDSMSGDEELGKDFEITSLLLEYGAFPKSALHLAQKRYGEFDPTMTLTSFTRVWKIIYDSSNK